MAKAENNLSMSMQGPSLAKSRQCIVILDANSYWTERLFTEFGNNYDVLLLKPRDFRAFYKKYGRLRSDKKPHEVKKGVWQQSFSMPPGWMFSIWWYAKRKILRGIKSFIQNKSLILVVNYPQYITIVGQLHPDMTVYYNTDDYSDHWPGKKEAVLEWERTAVLRSDLTICIARYRAEKLQKKYAEKCNRIFHVPLGVTPEFMAKSYLQKPNSLPTKISDLHRPVVGYIGALNWRFDYNFFSEVVTLMPNMTFVLGGEAPKQSDMDKSGRTSYRSIAGAKNVIFLGKVPHKELAKYLQSFDILIICYSENRFNKNSCPAKLWDYMGTSLPIVANDNVPEIRIFSDVIYLSKTPGDFLENLHLALREDREAMGNSRLKLARANTWANLSCKVQSIIREVLSESENQTRQ